MILLNVEKEEGKLVPRKQGATWDRDLINPYRKTGYNKGCWIMDNNVCGNLYKFKKWLVPEKITLADLCETLKTDVKVDRHAYTFRADVNNVFNLNDNALCILTLMTEHNMNRVIKAKITKDVLGDIDCNEFWDKEVEVTGALFLYAINNELQFEVTEIHIVGPCSRVREYEESEAKNADILKNKTTPPTFDKLIEKVGLIANKNTEGYKDFVKKLDKYIPDKNIFLKDVKLRMDDIIQAIKELNEENECDVVCIVRGGGNPESLVDFSRTELLRSIHSSKIPVITGIGHVSYKLLCNEAAFWHTDTPSAAAAFINDARRTFLGKKRGKETAGTVKVMNQQTTKHLNEISELKKEITGLNNQITDLNKKYTKVEDEKTLLKAEKESLSKEKTALQTENARLKRQIAELQKKVENVSNDNGTVQEKKGFFSKFFG